MAVRFFISEIMKNIYKHLMKKCLTPNSIVPAREVSDTYTYMRGQTVIEYFLLLAMVIIVTVVTIVNLRGGGGFVGSLESLFRTAAERMGGSG